MPQYTLWISARQGSRDRMVSGGARAGGHRRAHPQSGCARVVRVSPLGLRNHSDRQVPVLRDAGAGGRSDLGILRHSEPGARGFLFARRLRHGHVSDAADRPPRRVRQSDPARLHGVSELEVAALVLVRLQSFPVRAAHDDAGAGACWRWCSGGLHSARASPACIFRSSRRRSPTP